MVSHIKHSHFEAGLPSRLRAIAVVVAFASALLAQGVSARAGGDERGELRVGTSVSSPDTVVMTWRGPIAAPMAGQIKDAFEERKEQGTRVVFRISSGGGSVAEGERVIEVLRQIKKTHQLETVVGHGMTCGSMCVFIYVQGHKRVGALSSTWLFHEVSHADPVTKKIERLDRPRWERLVDTYFRPAGVSDTWIANMKPYTVTSDYWQTGADLVTAKSGIIHEALGNQTARIVTPSGRPQETARATPRAVASECKRYIASIGAVVSVPCS